MLAESNINSKFATSKLHNKQTSINMSNYIKTTSEKTFRFKTTDTRVAKDKFRQCFVKQVRKDHGSLLKSIATTRLEATTTATIATRLTDRMTRYTT